MKETAKGVNTKARDTRFRSNYHTIIQEIIDKSEKQKKSQSS
jgi:hypothetical protein